MHKVQVMKPADRCDHIDGVADDPGLLQEPLVAFAGVARPRLGGRLEQRIQVAGREVFHEQVHGSRTLERRMQLRGVCERGIFVCTVAMRQDLALKHRREAIGFTSRYAFEDRFEDVQTPIHTAPHDLDRACSAMLERCLRRKVVGVQHVLLHILETRTRKRTRSINQRVL